MADYPPKINTAFTATFAIRDNDGDLVTAAADLDSEVSKDGGTFTDCTNEAAEIATSSGIYRLAMTATEMNADIVAVVTKTSTANAKTAANILYTVTRQLVDLAYPTTSGRSIDVTATGEVGVDFDNINGTLDSSDIGNNAIGSAQLQTNAIGLSELASGAVEKIANGVLDELVTGTTSLRQLLKLFAAALAGKSSGGGTTTLTFRNIADDTDVIIATVDSSGNRTAMTLDVT